MLNPKPTYNLDNAVDLNKFLLGTLRELKNKEIEIERAVAISQISDKIIKNNLTRILYKKLSDSETPIEFFEGKADKELIIKK